MIGELPEGNKFNLRANHRSLLHTTKDSIKVLNRQRQVSKDLLQRVRIVEKSLPSCIRLKLNKILLIRKGLMPSGKTLL